MTVATQGISQQPSHHPQRKRTVIANSLSNLSDVISHHLMEPLPYGTVDTNIEHEAGERPPLHNASIGSKGLTIIAPAQHTIFALSQNHFCSQTNSGPPCSQPRFQGTAPSPGHHRLSAGPDKSGTGVPVLPMQALLQLDLHDGCPRTPSWKSAMKTIMEFDG
jgi:hypothetical protein